MMVGTIMMWVSLAHISTGITMNIAPNVKQSMQVFINFLLAGCGGGLGTFLATKLFQMIKIRSTKRKQEYMNIMDQ